MKEKRRTVGFGSKAKRKRSSGPTSLHDKVTQNVNSRMGFGLDGSGSKDVVATQNRDAGVYGSRKTASYDSRRNRKRRFRRNQEAMSSSSTIASIRTKQSMRSRTISPTSEVHVVCAISENLAKETCVASLDAGSPISMQVTKQGNGETYAETLAYLEVLQPHEVLLNEGRRNSQLARKVQSLFTSTASIIGDAPRPSNNQDRDEPQDDTGAVVKFISRSFFDQTKGAELLRKVVRPETYDASVAEDYILLSSSHAVLQYLQVCLGASLARKSLHVTVNALANNRMNIDRPSLVHLELLANAKTGKVAESLIGTIDSTKTTVGSRLLRTNLMSPPNSIETINARLDLVDTILNDEEFFYTVMEHLGRLPDIDKMLTNVALVPWTKYKSGTGDNVATPKMASKGISALVCIKSALGALPSFAQAIEDHLNKLLLRVKSRDRAVIRESRSTSSRGDSLLIGLGEHSTFTRTLPHHLLRGILAAMRQEQFQTVLEAIKSIFTDGTQFSRNPHAMRHHECFALDLKNEQGLIQLLRNTLLANVDEIYRLADKYAEEFSIKVTVKESTTRGYFLSVPTELEASLPPVFVQPVKKGRVIHCTTEEVLSLSSRAQDNVQDLLLKTHERIQEVLEVARCHYDALASLSDAIALLDMCHSFADNVASSRNPWCRPICNNGGDITIRTGRYGIDVDNVVLGAPVCGGAVGPGEFVPNDTYAPGHKNFTLITGVNGSGKSTYLRQIAIIVVLAHCGSYVPAERAIVPLRDRLCTRISTIDDQEHNISTFMLEMKEIAFICRCASSKSLILIDELGRATSNEDGVAIAWSVSEHLLSKRAMTFFVTHYPQLSKLSEVYSGVQNQHMGAVIGGNHGNHAGEVCYSHKILPGPCKAGSDYGVEMSKSCGWQDHVVRSAQQIRDAVETKLPNGSLSLISRTDQERLTTRAFQTAQGLTKRFSALGNVSDPERVRSRLQSLDGTVFGQDRDGMLAKATRAILDEEAVELQTTCNQNITPQCEHDEEIGTIAKPHRNQDDDSITSSSSLSSSSLPSQSLDQNRDKENGSNDNLSARQDDSSTRISTTSSSSSQSSSSGDDESIGGSRRTTRTVPKDVRQQVV